MLPCTFNSIKGDSNSNICKCHNPPLPHSVFELIKTLPDAKPHNKAIKSVNCIIPYQVRGGRTIWHQHSKNGQFGTKKANGQFGTNIAETDNLAPGQFGTDIIKRTIRHRIFFG